MGVESLGKVFFGTVPDYGTLGGALVVIDGKTDAVEVHRNIVPDHSIVSLAYAGGMVVGGTAIRGGLGIDPKAKEGKLFVWDPAAKKVVYESAPIPGTILITGLIAMGENEVWGIADGTLFIFDLNKRAITKTRKLFGLGDRKAGWRNAFMVMHPSGKLYGTAEGKLFRLDPKTLDAEVLREVDLGNLALDAAGHVYFRKGANLWRFSPAP